MTNTELRPMTMENRAEYAHMLHSSFNAWYSARGWSGDYFRCAETDAGIFLDVYEDLTPGNNIAAFDRDSGQLLGACFYHPRPHHMSFGIMSVHPDSFGRGVGKALTHYIIDLAKDRGLPLRLVGSAFNIDSFSLYNRAGFVPRESYNDMAIPVSEAYLAQAVPGLDHVREARLDDIAEMARIEKEISGITRELDYAYVIRNERDMFQTLVIADQSGDGLSGFLISVKHPALEMLGPAVSLTESDMVALVSRGLELYRGSTALLLIPMQKRQLVEQVYEWGGRNVETHLSQVHGEFYGFSGVSLPGFLPETG